MAVRAALERLVAQASDALPDTGTDHATRRRRRVVRWARALWQILVLVGVVGFTPAIGVHAAIGYTDPFHLAPAVSGAVLFVAGLAIVYPRRPAHHPAGL